MSAETPVASCVRCAEQLCEPAFFRRVAAMSGYAAREENCDPHKKYTPEDYAKARVELSTGEKLADIAAELGIPAGTLFRWRKKLEEAGAICPTPRRQRNALGKFEVSA